MTQVAKRPPITKKRKKTMQTTNKVKDPVIKLALQYLEDVSVFELSRIADCGSPDSNTSAGAELLDAIRVNLIDHLRHDAEAAVPVSDIADMSQNVYTHPIWLQFVDLCGYEEDLSDYMALGSTMTEQAQYVLANIAERTIVALCESLNLPTDQD